MTPRDRLVPVPACGRVKGAVPGGVTLEAVVPELLADGEAAGGARERRVQLTHEIEVDALPIERLAEPEALPRWLHELNRTAGVIEAFLEARDPHRFLGQHVVRLALCCRIASARRRRDGTLGIRHCLLVVAQVAVRVRELEVETTAESRIMELIQARTVALQQLDGLPEATQEV